jgi:hypothetical protein
MKTSTISKALPVLDADGYALCPDCNSRINCGTIGLANLEKHHRGMKAVEGSANTDDVILLYLDVCLIMLVS